MPRGIKVRQAEIQKVKQVLKRNGVSRQQDLADELNISKNTVWNFLNGKPVDYSNFVEICRRLSLDVQEIADFSDADVKVVQEQHECVIYFKAQEGTSFDDVPGFLLIDGLGIQTADTLKTADQKIAKIIEGLAQTRTLVVLDNLESILQPANHPQAGRAISPDWGKLLNALVYQHQSQTLLTSREVPADLADIRYEGAEPDSELVYIERISGVATVAGVEILRQRQLKDSVADLQWISERVEGV